MAGFDALDVDLVAVCPSRQAEGGSVRVVKAPPSSAVGVRVAAALGVDLYAAAVLTSLLVDESGLVRARCSLGDRSQHPRALLAECERLSEDPTYVQQETLQEAPEPPPAPTGLASAQLATPISGLKWNSAEKMFPVFFSDSKPVRGDSRLGDFLQDNPAAAALLAVAFLVYVVLSTIHLASRAFWARERAR